MVDLTNILKEEEANLGSEGPFQTGSYSIWPRAYEAELNSKYGIVLGHLKNGKAPEVMGNPLSKNVRFTEGLSIDCSRVRNEILPKYEATPGFCSMVVKDEEELERHVKKIHEASYSHYAVGKQKNFFNTFPRACCGHSAKNMLLNLMSLGYPNAASLYNNHKDHVYMGLPFVMDKRKGFIIVDPTSDQLFDNKEKAPRNNTFVVFGDKWEYLTDWKDGEDLFPAEKDQSRFINLATIKKDDGKLQEDRHVYYYLREVFNHPVEVSVEI